MVKEKLSLKVPNLSDRIGKWATNSKLQEQFEQISAYSLTSIEIEQKFEHFSRKHKHCLLVFNINMNME